MIPMRSNVAIKITKKKERMKPFTRKHFFYDVKIMRGTAAVYGVFVTIFFLYLRTYFCYFFACEEFTNFWQQQPSKSIDEFFLYVE